MTDTPIPPDDPDDWPDPLPDPDDEPGEDPETHLLPNPTRMRALDAAALRSTLEAVRAWQGPTVEAFRAAANERLRA